jgi:rod shape-determining protein MreC
MRQGGRTYRGLLITLIVCAGLTILHRQRLHFHRTDPVTGTLRDLALVPGQSLVFGLDHWWRQHVTALWQGPRLARENLALKTQLLSLEAQNKELLAAQAENETLRRELGFEKRSPLPLLPAEVVALKPSAQADTLTLNRGSRNGVKLSMVVLSPEGALVGQVVDLSSDSSNVLMLTDAGSSAGAEVVVPGAPPAQADRRIGLCRGDHLGHLTLTIPRIDADLQPGDQVVTSGLGAVFPKGIPIGTVRSVHTDRIRAVRQALLRPAADFDHLEQAFLVQ